MVNIETCFDLDLFEFKSIEEIKTSPLTEYISRCGNFDSVLENVKDMYSDTDIELMAGVCGISEQEVCRQLLEKEIISVLDFFDYWEQEETKQQYIEIYNAYEKCLLSE